VKLRRWRHGLKLTRGNLSAHDFSSCRIEQLQGLDAVAEIQHTRIAIAKRPDGRRRTRSFDGYMANGIRKDSNFDPRLLRCGDRGQASQHRSEGKPCEEMLPTPGFAGK
jgi:hypothetical protein